MDVGASVLLAAIAIASGVDGSEICLEAGIFEVDAVLFGVALRILTEAGDKSVAVAGETSGRDAVKDVDTAIDALNEVDRLADTHKIAELVCWKVGDGEVDRFVHIFFALVVVGDTADRVAVEAELDGFFGGETAKVLMRAALDDTKEGLVRVAVDGFAAGGPAESALETVF